MPFFILCSPFNASGPVSGYTNSPTNGASFFRVQFFQKNQGFLYLLPHKYAVAQIFPPDILSLGKQHLEQQFNISRK